MQYKAYVTIYWVHLNIGFGLQACDGLVPFLWRRFHRGEEGWEVQNRAVSTCPWVVLEWDNNSMSKDGDISVRPKFKEQTHTSSFFARYRDACKALA